MYYLYDCIKYWLNEINLVFRKVNNYVIGEKINLGKKFKYRIIIYFLKMFIFLKIKFNVNNCMDIEKKN